MFGEGGFGIGQFLSRVLGITPQQPRPREIPPYDISGPATITGSAGTPSTRSTTQATMPQQQMSVPMVPPQVQEDPLVKFERMARLMNLGERVGSAFDKQPYEVISRGGGVAAPQLPQSGGYGLSVLR